MITIRKANTSDEAFILDSFVEEFRASVYCDEVPRTLIRGLLLEKIYSPSWNVTILCDDETEDEIIAYVVWKDSQHIAWVHVKGIYRRQGFAKQILREINADKGRIKTPFIPSPEFSRGVRKAGWNLLHRPWMT